MHIYVTILFDVYKVVNFFRINVKFRNMNKEFPATLEKFFMALADRTRIRLLNLMREEEVCVGFLTEVLGDSQPKISRHLAYLRYAGLVEARRDGKWMYYRLVYQQNKFAAQVLADVLDWLDSDDEMRRDYEKLLVIFDEINSPATASNSSQSNIYSQTDMNFVGDSQMETFLL